jgi:Protein of unknown function (DUF3224)
VSRAVATFVSDVYEEGDAVERDGVALRRVYIERTFSGDIEGRSAGELTTSGLQDGVAAYVAIDVISGTLDGREGSFVLSHRGTVSAAGATTAGEVVQGSGSGGLDGLEGTAEIIVEDGVHRLVLEYGV